jgi:hypothetical protein
MKMPIAEDAEVAEARREKQSRPLLYFVALAQWVASNAFRARATLARMSFADAVTPRTHASSGI